MVNLLKNLVWMDLEMTGLHPEKHAILQIAMVITDSELNIIDEGIEIVVHQSEDVFKNMDPNAKAFHEKSGLLEKVRNSKISLQEAETQLLNRLEIYVERGESPLCGNSIHRDRMFIEKYMPNLNEYLHYRLIDISTVKELKKLWKHETEEYPKRETHTALQDINESIEELRFYSKEIFKI